MSWLVTRSGNRDFVKVPFENWIEIYREDKGDGIFVKTESEIIPLKTEDRTVSRHCHARIYLEGGKLLIKDAGSTVGTRVNGALLPSWKEKHHSEPVEIKHDSEIQVGASTRLRILLEEGIPTVRPGTDYDWASLAQQKEKEAFELQQINDDKNNERIASLLEEAEYYYRKDFEEEKAEGCRREALRYRELPDISFCISADSKLILGQWEKLEIEIQNIGYGIAKGIALEASSNLKLEHDREVGIGELRKDESKNRLFSVNPSESGRAVPIEFTIRYRDHQNQKHQIIKSGYVAIGREQHYDTQGKQTLIVHGDYIKQGEGVILKKGRWKTINETEAEDELDEP